MYNLRFWGRWKLWGFVTLQAFLNAVLTFLYKFCGCTAGFYGSVVWLCTTVSRLKQSTGNANSTDIIVLVLQKLTYVKVGRDDSVGIATHCGLDGRGIVSRWERNFHTGPGAYPAPFNMGIGFLSLGKRPARGLDHPLPYRAKVEEIVKLYL
jgi:hypothetical protein